MTIIGLGNDFRHDDAAGLIAVRRLQEAGLSAEEHNGDWADLIEKWKRCDEVVLIDAVSSGAPAGTLHRINARISPLPPGHCFGSTHTLGLAEAVELSRTLETLPARLLILGIEGRDFSPGIGLSVEVDRALVRLLEEVQMMKL